MPRYTYQKAAHAALLDELAAAGVPTLTPAGGSAVAMDDTTVWVTADAAHRATVDAVIAAHDPAVYQAREDAARSAYQQAIDYLKTYRQKPNASITVDEVKNATKALTDIAKVQHQQLREQGAG